MSFSPFEIQEFMDMFLLSLYNTEKIRIMLQCWKYFLKKFSGFDVIRRPVNLMIFFRLPGISPCPTTYYLAGYFCYHFIISLAKVNNFVEILTIIWKRIALPNSLFTFALGKKGGSCDPPFRFCLCGRLPCDYRMCTIFSHQWVARYLFISIASALLTCPSPL